MMNLASMIHLLGPCQGNQVKPYPTLPYPTLSFPTLPYSLFPYPTLPYPSKPNLTLPFPALFPSAIVPRPSQSEKDGVYHTVLA